MNQRQRAGSRSLAERKTRAGLVDKEDPGSEEHDPGDTEPAHGKADATTPHGRIPPAFPRCNSVVTIRSEPDRTMKPRSLRFGQLRRVPVPTTRATGGVSTVMKSRVHPTRYWSAGRD